jgi:hypothetical protein
LPTTWSGSLLAIVSRHSVIPATGRPPQPPPLNLPMTLPASWTDCSGHCSAHSDSVTRSASDENGLLTGS